MLRATASFVPGLRRAAGESPGLLGGHGGFDFLVPLEKSRALGEQLLQLAEVQHGLAGEAGGAGAQGLRLTAEERDVFVVGHERYVRA